VSSTTAASLASRLVAAVGNAYVKTGPDSLAEYEVDGMIPSAAVLPATAEEASEIVKIALEEKLGVIPCGARTAMGIGMPPWRHDLALDMTRVRGIAHYDPGDLTVSVNAGMPLAEFAKILAEQHQSLPLAVPYFARATVGGAVAAGLDSPLRHFYGTVRDYLIGAEFVDGTGALTKSGGRVVKNVTGYDFHKLLNGSLGSLAVITRLNFRTFPLQHSRRGFVASFEGETGALGFVKALGESPLTPTVLDVVSPEFARLFLEERSPIASLRIDSEAWTVCVGFEGTNEVCDRYARDLARLARTAAAQNAVTILDSQFVALIEILREAPALMSRAARQAMVFRFATLPSQLPDLLRAVRSFANSAWASSAVLVRSTSVVYLALLLDHRDESAAKQVSYFWNSVGSLRGRIEFQASIPFCPTEWKSELNVWEYAPSNQDLQRRTKRAFDPNDTFARGRLVRGI
jgi:glycolate oxidase FAD binding subunit